MSLTTRTTKVLAGALLAAACVFLPACSAQGPGTGPSVAETAAVKDALEGYPQADMGGYSCAQDYELPYHFAELSVADVASLMQDGATFALYCGYEDCPWCNVALNHLNNVADELGLTVGYIDTRADPSWTSNVDIEGYDTFVELFGSALDDDDEGRKHLYVPHVFFVRDGALVDDHPGTVSSQESPSDPLTDDQAEELQAAYRAGFELAYG